MLGLNIIRISNFCGSYLLTIAIPDLHQRNTYSGIRGFNNVGDISIPRFDFGNVDLGNESKQTQILFIF